MTDTLDKLKKAFEQTISTVTAVQPWNEPLSRRDAVQSGQVLTTPLVQGGLGAWAGSSGFPYTGTNALGVQTGAQPPSRNSFEMGLGLPGVPDVDFVPYAAGTNRFGGKGPSLIGHPISWEVVGPTLKSPYCDWQWHVDTGLNTLTLEAGPYPMPTGGLPANITPEAYGPNLTGFDALGGLYVLFTFTGENFTGSLAGGRTPITPTFKYRAPFEIFRVLSIDAPALTIALRPEKLIATYFGAGDGCRAITLIRPKVARLAAFPVPVIGQAQANRTFVFLPPETAASSEYMPPLKSAGLGTWSAGGFDVAGTIPGGNTAVYGNPVKLPIPRPIVRVDAEIPFALVPPLRADEWQISVPVGNAELKVGRIVRISNLTDNIPSGISPNASHAYGYFEIRAITVGPPDILFLGRVTEANPDTGEIFYGNGPIASGAPIPVSLEVYDNISTIFSTTTLNLENLASARLVNLIDPRTVGPSIARRDLDGAPVPASKPDRAIFNTRLGEDPGNLLDLGFRSILFPSKQLAPGGPCIPDFDKPLDSNEVTLNPAVSERQYIEIDYSAGVAYLSHTPDAGNMLCEVTPNGFGPILSAPNNPRKEIVLFGACVPYSMEEGQSGSGFRITGSSPGSIDNGFGTNDLADVFGRRIITEPFGALQTLNPATPVPITTTLTSLGDIPFSGFFFVGYALPGSTITTKFGPYYYQYTDAPLGRVRLNGITGPAGIVVLDPSLPDGSKIVLQRSLRSFAPLNASADTVRGSSKRINTLAFKNADLSFGADGSVTIEPRIVGYGLDAAYRQGLTSTPGIGRVIVSDGGPVETRPAGSSTFYDPFVEDLSSQVRSRYDYGIAATGDKAGFDFIGRRSNVGPVPPYSDIDNFAGFIDRRVFAPQTLLGYTILGDLATGSPLFNVDIVAADRIQLTTGGNKFHNGGGTKETLLLNGVDLIHLPNHGVFAFSTAFGAAGDEYTLLNLDGSVPVLPLVSVKGCTAYRPRFMSGRGFDGIDVVPIMGGTWITSQGEKPALRLYAGSGTVFGGPDEGGSTESLEFWYRSLDRTPRSDNSFDTYGRLFSQNLILGAADQSLRGPYLTRTRKTNSLAGGSLFGMGHIVETVPIGVGSPVRSFDFLSLHASTMGTTPSVSSFSYTVISADTVRLTGGLGFTHRRLSLSGGTFVDLTSYSGTGNHIGLYRIIGTTNPGGVGTADLQLLRLDNTVPTLTVAETGSSQVFTAAYTGVGIDSYYNYAGVLQSHIPTSVVGVGELNTSVGLHVSGPDPVVVVGGAAIRVTSLDPTAPGKAFERFRVDLTGSVSTLGDIDAVAGNITAAVNVTATTGDVVASAGDVTATLGDVNAGGDFLYVPAPVARSVKISPYGFSGSTFTTDTLDPQIQWFTLGGQNIQSRIASSSLWKDLAGVLQSACIITSIDVRVRPGFARGVGDRFAIWLVQSINTSAATTTLGTVEDNGIVAEQTMVLTPTIPGVPLDFKTYSYYLTILSGRVNATSDNLYGVTLHFTDPGPRNW